MRNIDQICKMLEAVGDVQTHDVDVIRDTLLWVLTPTLPDTQVTGWTEESAS